jgi:hypothetical protein
VYNFPGKSFKEKLKTKKPRPRAANQEYGK